MFTECSERVLRCVAPHLFEVRWKVPTLAHSTMGQTSISNHTCEFAEAQNNYLFSGELFVNHSGKILSKSARNSQKLLIEDKLQIEPQKRVFAVKTRAIRRYNRQNLKICDKCEFIWNYKKSENTVFPWTARICWDARKRKRESHLDFEEISEPPTKKQKRKRRKKAQFYLEGISRSDGRQK